MKKILNFSIFIILFALYSCGYSLRDNQLLETNIKSIELNLSQPNSEFSRILRRNLELAGVNTIASNVSQETTSNIEHELIISSEEISTRPVTINSRARAAQYEMRLSLEIALKNSERVLVEPETIFVDRIYFEDIQNITGNQEEIRLIISEMRQDLLLQVMRRIESALN
tara:strand:+ start:136 stop:645 length:510 start_codon:yes stop_codon:yes gene_type:complete